MPNNPADARLIEVEPSVGGVPPFSAYKRLTPAVYKKAVSLAKDLKGKKIFHINSSASGGGVAELLKSQVPLERSLGLDSRWFVIRAAPHFFEVTKKIHNLLQGKSNDRLNALEKEYYLDANSALARELKNLVSGLKPAYIVIHDPQPLPLVEAIRPDIRKIFRLHIDSSTPDESTFAFLQPYITAYDKAVFTNPLFIPRWYPKKKAALVAPAIDPFTPKNKEIKGAEEI